MGIGMNTSSFDQEVDQSSNLTRLIRDKDRKWKDTVLIINTRTLVLPVISIVYTVLVIIAALIGVVLTFVLMSSAKHSSRSYSVYFRLLVLSELFTLAVILMYEIEDLKWAMNKPMFVGKLEVCLVTMSIFTVSHLTSMWALAALAIDRFISISRPHRHQTCTTKQRALFVSIVIILASFSVASMLLLISIRGIIEAFEVHGVCSVEGMYEAGVIVDFIPGYVAPLAVTFALTGRVLCILKRLPDDTENLTATNGTMFERGKRGTYYLQIVAVISLITLLPLHTLYFFILAWVKGIVKVDIDTLVLAVNFVFFIAPLNYCNKFYVLLIVDPTCRRDLIDIFRSFTHRDCSPIVNENTECQIELAVPVTSDCI